MYNIAVCFDGDIIITDPCYLMKKGTYNIQEAPAWWDFISKTTFEMKDGIKHYHYPSPDEYDDCVEVPVMEYFKDGGKCYIEKLLKGQISKDSENLKGYKIKVSPTLNAESDAYHKAEEKYHEEHKEDWEICEYGENMEVLGFKTYLVDGTGYGDWGCTVYDDKKQKIGEFCADAGLVGVFLLDEVLKYNPDFNYHLERPWTTTLIKDFHGTVEIKSKMTDDGYPLVTVVGVGNVNFKSEQTSL